MDSTTFNVTLATDGCGVLSIDVGAPAENCRRSGALLPSPLHL